MGWLDGQVALVTGGGSGIGQAIVERLLKEGAKVGVMDRAPERLEQLKSEFDQDVVGIQGDATALESNVKAVDGTVGAFGKLDVFIGNAGVFDGNQRFSDFPTDSFSLAFDGVFGINVKGWVQKHSWPSFPKPMGEWSTRPRPRLRV